MRTEDVAEFVVGTQRAALPRQIDEWARWALLDTLSVMFAGHQTSTAQAASRTATRDAGAVRILGGTGSATPAMAAFAGAVAANALDFEDGHYAGGGIHAGSTVVPTLLAVADEHTTLEAFRRAMVIGYEVAIRAGHLLSPAHSGQHYRASGHAASLGATAAIAALNEFDHATVVSALRIAASHAPSSTMNAAGARESIGWAAATATTAAQLAADGYTNSDADSTFAPPTAPSPLDDPQPGALAGSLGETWEAPNCYLKPYACCRVIHASLDAVDTLCQVHGLEAEDIDELTVWTIPGAEKLSNLTPVSLEQAQFSIPVAVATFMLHGTLGAGQSNPGIYKSSDVLSFAQRVTVRVDPALIQAPDRSYAARVVITGTAATVSKKVTNARGSQRNPASDQERREKAAMCLRAVLDEKQADRLVALLAPGPSSDCDPAMNTVDHLRKACRLPSARATGSDWQHDGSV